MVQKYYSNGKLLLTGEYAILDGAVGLAVPTKYGQTLEFSYSNSDALVWKSYDVDNTIWFEVEYGLTLEHTRRTSDKEKAAKLLKILKKAKELNPKFLKESQGIVAETHLSFPRNWGLGTSSTLVNNIAQWAKIDAFELLSKTLGGSGYDIACAQNFQPILYQLDLGQPKVSPVLFNPEFKQRLFFVYLNKKQDSREAIANYRLQRFNKQELLSKVNTITQHMLEAKTIEQLESHIIEHEQVLAKVLGQSPVKRKFPDYFGAIKSLGAWGGDFILVTGNEKTPDYFKAKGFSTVISYEDMVI